MPKKVQPKRKIAKKSTGSPKLSQKEMRFSISLVILIGLLSFSMLMLLLILNKSVEVKAKTFSDPRPSVKILDRKQPISRILDDNSLDFKLTIPAELGEWVYKTGEVKSITDDSATNSYLRIYVPLPKEKSNNFDEKNIPLLTIRKFSDDEWEDIEKICQKDEYSGCAEAGDLIQIEGADSSVYTYKKFAECPESIKAKCALADKILESFEIR